MDYPNQVEPGVGVWEVERVSVGVMKLGGLSKMCRWLGVEKKAMFGRVLLVDFKLALARLWRLNRAVLCSTALYKELIIRVEEICL